MQQLAATQHDKPRHFQEQRHSDLLQNYILLRGTLSFANGILQKKIDTPFKEQFTVDGEILRIKKAEKEQQISLNDHPLLLGFVTIFQATLKGDMETLKTHYLTELSGTKERWQLHLIPRDRHLADQLKEITIKGNERWIQKFTIVEQSGDRSIMALGDEL